MFRYLKLKNYQSLVNLDVDFMNNVTSPKHLVAVYGENGAGKTNFADAFLTLIEILDTRKNVPILNENMPNVSNPMILDFLKYNFKDMKSIIDNYKTIDSKDNMVLEYGFRIDGKNGSYYLEMNDEELVHEKLNFVLNKNVVNFFDITSDNIDINADIFLDKKYYKEVNDEVAKYWGKHSLLSLILFDRYDRKKSYVDDRIHSSLKNLLLFFLNMKVSVKEERKELSFEIDNLVSGVIDSKKENELNCYEKLLNKFYTSLYSDIKKAYYKRKIKDNNIEFKLYFKKLIYNEIKDIPFELESTGTRRLIKVLPYLLNATQGNISVIDEIDTACHDILIDKILNNIKNDLKGQLIITTHNTLLLEDTLSAKEAYVFYINNDASKELVSLDQFEKSQPNLNKRKRYLVGMYGGLPYPMDVDFLELNETLKYEED